MFVRTTIARAHRIARCLSLPMIALAIPVFLVLASILPPSVAYAKSGDWPTYMGNNQRTGFNATETIINPTSAPNLKVHWKILAAEEVTSQPIEAHGMVYWGSWDGLEHATNASTGHDVWTANLGQSAASCFSTKYGVLSSADVASIQPLNKPATAISAVQPRSSRQPSAGSYTKWWGCSTKMASTMPLIAPVSAAHSGRFNWQRQPAKARITSHPLPGMAPISTPPPPALPSTGLPAMAVCAH